MLHKTTEDFHNLCLQVCDQQAVRKTLAIQDEGQVLDNKDVSQKPWVPFNGLTLALKSGCSLARLSAIADGQNGYAAFLCGWRCLPGYPSSSHSLSKLSDRGQMISRTATKLTIAHTTFTGDRHKVSRNEHTRLTTLRRKTKTHFTTCVASAIMEPDRIDIHVTR